MKQIILSLVAMCSVFAAQAQSCVTLQQVSADYAVGQVTFDLKWGTCNNTNHLYRVWVFVDYRTVTGATKGAWTRAAIVGSDAGELHANNGVWITGTANATQRVTLTLNVAGDKFDWCAFAGDCPPRIISSSNGNYTFAGTSPFVLTAAGGATQQVHGNTLAHSALAITPISLTDQTNCPGIFCPYMGSDLYIDAAHICQLRTGGAKNWEAYIRDSRDNNLYRIVQYSDNSWWFADDLATADKRVAICSDGRSYYDGANQPACPAGWRIPTLAEGKNRWPNGLKTDAYGGAMSVGYIVGNCNATVSGCNTGYGLTRVDLIWSGCINTTGWNGTDWIFNCSPQSCSAVARVGARVRCVQL